MKYARLAQLCCVAALASLAPAMVAGQASAPGGREVPALFSSHELIEFRIEADYRTLRGDRTQESEYRPAVLKIADDDGADRTIDIRVRTRGNYRLQNCRFPPMRVNLPRNSMGGTVFDGQNGIKLVSHCQGRGHAWAPHHRDCVDGDRLLVQGLGGSLPYVDARRV